MRGFWKSISESPRILPPLLGAAFVLACACSGLSQSPTPVPGTTQTQQPAPARPIVRKKHVPAARAAAEPASAAETRLPDPPKPDWPVNDKAKPASVSWDGRDLSISASNSSLEQILKDVSVATGLKVDGIQDDQRIFGVYGPAPARDVLSTLLDGSGYNVLMIGDLGEGTPRQLVLTAKSHAAGGQQAAAQGNQNNDDEAAEDPEPPEQPASEPPLRRPGTVLPPGPGRTPQQFLQEMQQRRQQLQEQQPQSQPQASPPTPPQN